MNRIGDLGFLLGIFLIYVTFGSVSYSEVFAQAKFYGADEPVLIAITLLLFVGAMGKSAQLPLYTWLPDAMAGPTPVSALIHAATMVTAGIYMIARSNILYTLAPVSLHVVALIGVITAVFAATIGLLQNDIKKVLAYSTVSQLGYMFLALGMGAYTSAVFHVITHAFFKALLFLGAGSVIHAMGGEQDIRKMGGLKSHLPTTFATFLIGTIAIAGIPPFAGFFSKDEILAHAFSHNKIFW
jgi:NADH-quinone oxidoreductase subunit L